MGPRSSSGRLAAGSFPLQEESLIRVRQNKKEKEKEKEKENKTSAFNFNTVVVHRKTPVSACFLHILPTYLVLLVLRRRY